MGRRELGLCGGGTVTLLRTVPPNSTGGIRSSDCHRFGSHFPGPHRSAESGGGAPPRFHGLRLGRVQVDERDPDVGPQHLAQVRWGLGHNGLQRRVHPRLEEVSPTRGPVR
jgi:hypothetical protein